MRVKNEDLLDDSGPLDLAVSQILKSIYLEHVANFSVQLVTTGTPAGTFKLQASNDEGHINAATGVNQETMVNWTDIADSTVTVSSAGTVMFDVADSAASWVRVIWTASGGSIGTLTSARANTKGV